MKSQKTTLPSRYIVVKYDAPLPRLYLVCWTKTTLLSVVEGSEFYNYSNPVCLPTKTSTHALKLVYIFVCLHVGLFAGVRPQATPGPRCPGPLYAARTTTLARRNRRRLWRQSTKRMGKLG